MGKAYCRGVNQRLRNDDGTLSTATWLADLNTNATIDVDTKFRLRLSVEEYGGGVFTINGNLYYSLNSGTYTAVTTTSPVQAVASDNSITDDTACATQRLASESSWNANGRYDDDGNVESAVGMTSEFAEFEFCLQIDSAQVSDEDTIELRIHDDTLALSSYTNIVVITVNEGLPPVSEDLEMEWDIANLVNEDLEAEWDIFNLVNDDLEAVWDIFDLVNDDLEAVWDIRNLVSEDIQGLYDIHEFVYDDLEAVWDILSGDAQVSEDLEAVWDIRELVNEDLEAVWDITNLVNEDIEAVWDILNSVSLDIEPVYDIFNLVNEDIEAVWDIRNEVTKDLEAVWDMSGSVNKDLEMVYDLGETGGGGRVYYVIRDRRRRKWDDYRRRRRRR